MLLLFLLITVFSLLPSLKGDDSYVLMCYWYPECGLEAEHLDPYLCTHIIYYVETSNIENGRMLNKTDNKLLNVARLKRRNPDLNLLLGIDTDLFLHTTFSINTLQDILRFYSFDGVDVAWEYISDWSDNEVTVLNKLKELKVLFARFKQLLTLTVYGSIVNLYNIKKHSDLANQVDLISFALFDFDQSAPIAPVAPLNSENHFNLKFAVDYLLGRYVAREKLVLALPNFGLRNNTGFRELQEIKTLPYNKICSELEKNPRIAKQWDSTSSTPYFVIGNQITYYDNLRSHREKLKLIKSRRLKGAMSYTLEQEDFDGSCSEGRFPLIKQMRLFLDTYPEEFDFFILIKNQVLFG